MTPEAQQIAIAEACGWKSTLTNGFITSVWQRAEKGIVTTVAKNQLPNYLTDLNAMHEAEKKLTNFDVGAEYSRQLIAIYTRLLPSVKFVETFYWHATAAQRAEAFLRTIRKWEDNAYTCGLCNSHDPDHACPCR